MISGQYSPQRDSNRSAAFEIDVGNKVHVTIDFELAIRVGEFLLLHRDQTNDKQILSLGHNLVKLADGY